MKAAGDRLIVGAQLAGRFEHFFEEAVDLVLSKHVIPVECAAAIVGAIARPVRFPLILGRYRMPARAVHLTCIGIL